MTPSYDADLGTTSDAEHHELAPDYDAERHELAPDYDAERHELAPDYDAELYELVHRGTPGDVEFYVAQLRYARRILEIGCGYGRVLSALAKAHPEAELVGLDHHPGLLDRARARLPPRVHLVQGDLRGFELDGVFDAIIAPYSTLWCLGSDAEMQDCLRAVRAHLEPSGRFLFDAYSADGFHGLAEPEPEDAEAVFVGEVERRGERFRVFEQSEWRPVDQTFLVRYLHEPIAPGKPIEAVIPHRYLLVTQLLDHLAGADLEALGLWGGFSGEALVPEAEQLVVEAAVRAP